MVIGSSKRTCAKTFVVFFRGQKKKTKRKETAGTLMRMNEKEDTSVCFSKTVAIDEA